MRKTTAVKVQRVVQPAASPDFEAPIGSIVLLSVNSDGSVQVVFPGIQSDGPDSPPETITVTPTTTVAALFELLGMMNPIQH